MTQNIPLVSVIVRTHNRADLLRNALDCLLNQTWPNLEVWVIDHNSSDNTYEVVQSFQGKINYIKHSGSYHDTFNVWRNHINGEFLSFLDDDDYIKPECIQKLMAVAIKKQNIDIVYSRTRYFVCEMNRCNIIHETEWFAANEIKRRLLSANIIPMNAVLIRRRCLDKIPLITEKISGSFDWHFWVYAATAGFNFCQLPLVLGYIQKNPHSVQRNLDMMSLGGIECIRYYGTHLKFRKKIAYGYYHILGYRLIRHGLIQMEKGRVQKGQKLLLKGLSTYFFSLRDRHKWIVALLLLFASIVSDGKKTRSRFEKLLGCYIFRNYYEIGNLNTESKHNP